MEDDCELMTTLPAKDTPQIPPNCTPNVNKNPIRYVFRVFTVFLCSSAI